MQGKVSMEDSRVKCLNQWDSQMKRIYQTDGIYSCLQANSGAGGRTDGVVYAIDQQGGKSNCGYAEDVMMTLCSDSHGTPHAVCYAIEGNVVDRVSAKNGKGWCEDVSPTLNTQDRHAVVFALEGNGARPSHLGKGFSDDGAMYTLNTIEQHSVCYGISRSLLKGGMNGGGIPLGEDLQPTMTSNGTGAVCYSIENHPNDSRARIDPDGIVQTLSSRMGTGGNNTPFVLITDGEDAMMNNGVNWDGQDTIGTLTAHNAGGNQRMPDKDHFTAVIQNGNQQKKYVLRRLTPTECARLQGFPDWWCDGADGSDSAQYKLWGNGIALPCAVDVLGRIAEEIRNNG